MQPHTTPAVTVGPFRFRFYPDGDDPGTGLLELATESGYECRTNLGVSTQEWESFLLTIAATPVY